MLITLPDYDDVTKYLHVWNQDVIKAAERNSLEPILSKGKNVVRSQISKIIESKDPKLIILNGHGDFDRVLGHQHEPIIILGENENLLKDRIVHAFTCSSARELGKKCKAKAFIGYSDLFFLCVDRFSINRPREDKFAGPVLECAIEAPLQLAKRKTAKEAFESSQVLYGKWIDEFTVSNSKYTTEELQLILPILHWNKLSQTLHGDPEARR